VLSAGATLTQGVLALIGLSAVAAVPQPLYRAVPSTLAQAAAVLLLGLLVGSLGGAADVAKAALVRHDSSLNEALRHALKCLRRSPFVAALGWLPWAALFALLAFVGAELCASIDVARAGGWRVWMVFGIHQLLVVSAVFARTAWYARALRLVATTG
jgi:hypothetical protein